MRIKRKAIVKHVLTNELREKMWNDLESEKERLEREYEQLRFQMHKQWKTGESTRRKEEVKRRFEKELEKRQEKVKQVIFQQSQLEQLELGSLLTTGKIDILEEIQPGDPWPLKEKEVIVKDGKIQEIIE